MRILLGAVVGLFAIVGTTEALMWIHRKQLALITATIETLRLSAFKKQLTSYELKAGKMHELILAEKIATQNLPEAERNKR